MMKLEDAGYARTKIAEQLGVSRSHVSRSLLSEGRRKLDRRPDHSGRLMTWHPQGQGWVKRYKGKRYFIGLGKGS